MTVTTPGAAIHAFRDRFALCGDRSFGTVSLMADMAFCLAGALPARASVRNAVHFAEQRSFILGAAFAYYVLFPPAARYLLGLGGGQFQLLLNASDYLDFITIIMLAMGGIFQMPAITYVLARIGVVNARLSDSQLEDIAHSYTYSCRCCFAYRRYSQHAAFRVADDGPLRRIDRHCLVIWKTSTNRRRSR